MAAITAATVGAAGALLGGAAGAYNALKEQPKNQSTSTTSMAPMTEQERQLQQQSLENYMKQQQYANDYESQIGSAQGIQDSARSGVQNILSGQSMQMTPQEQAQIQSIRDAMVAQGTTDVNRLLDTRTAQANQSAGTRGLRGQAGAQLQGDALRAAAQQQGDFSRQANLYAAQQATALPYQRIAAQGQYLTQGMSFADQMRQQAQQNRQVGQSPYMMNLLNNNRLATATKTTNGTQPMQGDWSSAVGGAMGAAGAGLNWGGQMGQAWGNMFPSSGSSGGGSSPALGSYGSTPMGSTGGYSSIDQWAQ